MFAKIYVIGAGGSGGGGSKLNDKNGGGGDAGDIQYIERFQLIKDLTYNITVGPGQRGMDGNNHGLRGGSSQFGSVIVNGGNSIMIAGGISVIAAGGYGGSGWFDSDIGDKNKDQDGLAEESYSTITGSVKTTGLATGGLSIQRPTNGTGTSILYGTSSVQGGGGGTNTKGGIAGNKTGTGGTSGGATNYTGTATLDYGCGGGGGSSYGTTYGGDGANGCVIIEILPY